ncbi:hypothetical protein BDV97DRAFT_344905 [Delphinella strobiligena]|nr:hypothetical protein BDV97DRAFT_344905 [Delphinella strobiligena]
MQAQYHIGGPSKIQPVMLNRFCNNRVSGMGNTSPFVHAALVFFELVRIKVEKKTHWPETGSILGPKSGFDTKTAAHNNLQVLLARSVTWQ